MKLTQILLIATVTSVLLTAAAWADGKTGMFWTSNTAADDVSVRRLNDSTNGVVCYVAKSTTPVYGAGVSVAISCIKAP